MGLKKPGFFRVVREAVGKGYSLRRVCNSANGTDYDGHKYALGVLGGGPNLHYFRKLSEVVEYLEGIG